METARLGVGPGVERADDLAAAVGVGAVVLPGAGVADLGLGAVADQAALAVELWATGIALGAEPVVVLLVVAEAGGPVAQGAPVGVGESHSSRNAPPISARA